jgi:putative transcriptional regulator
MGGLMLDDLKPVAVSDGALAGALARLSEPVRTQSAIERDENLPAPLAPYELGPWRWIGSGVHWRSVSVPVVNGVRVFMLRAEGGTHLPRHRHQGIEWTCVLGGAFRHDLGRFGSGDFDEADETIEHNPVVEPGEPCICLVALEGNIELQSWLGRLLQPLIRL